MFCCLTYSVCNSDIADDAHVDLTQYSFFSCVYKALERQTDGWAKIVRTALVEEICNYLSVKS